MPNANWRDLILALGGFFVAPILLSGSNASLAQPAVDGAKTYAVVTMVGDRLTFVSRRGSVSTHLDHYDRRTQALGDDTLATTVLRTMANAVVAVAPNAKTELLEIGLPPPRGAESIAGEELVTDARETLRRIVGSRSWDFIVLLGPRRQFEPVHRMGPNLEGLGFYVDPGTSRGYRPLRVDDDTWRADRFISPFVSSQVWLLDAKTLNIMATQSIYGYCRYTKGEPDSLDPWQSFDSEKMLKLLALTIQHDVGEATKTLLRKGLGMPLLPTRVPVEFCTHRYD